MTEAHLDVPFAGAGQGEAELTWGQRAMYQAMLREDSWLPMGGHLPLPAGTTVGDVAGELGYLMSRYQACRTRLLPGPRQSVAAAGVTRLAVVEAGDADPAEVAAHVERDLRATPPDLARDWPLRMAVVCRAGVPSHLVSIMPHLVTDGAGAAVMLAESARRVEGPIPGLTPLDLVAWQASAAGTRQHGGARRHWERHAATIGPLPSRAVDEPRQRYRKCLFDSRRLSARLPEVAARTGVDSSTVLLAAYLAALSSLTGQASVAVRQVVSNRFRSGLSEVVSPITQLGLCVAEIPTAFEDAVAAVARAALPARKYAYYDPFDIPPLATACFNDRRSVAAMAAFGAPALDAPAGEPAWTDPPTGPTEPLFLHADDLPGLVRLTLDVDTAYFSPADAESVARTIERLI